MLETWTVVDVLDTGEQAEVASLIVSIERSGDEALTEAQRGRLDAGTPVRHALRRSGEGELTGYAVLGDEMFVEAEPALGTFDLGLAELLEHEPGPVSLLLRDFGPGAEAPLLSRGWHVTRTLHRLSRPLPADPPPPHLFEVRAFEPGHDDEAWVTENNEAFAGHPTQGSMTVERLRARFSAPWFDPGGFLLFFEAEQLVASCWTKLHPVPGGAVGEIYVVSVSPKAQGRGLGRIAVLEGLSSLTAHGASSAELYVEASNTAAHALYDDLGFTLASRVVELVWRGEHPAAEQS